jgi:hypothetical protein
MSAITTRNGDNYNYATAADFTNVNGDLIRRTGITADSIDLISVTAINMMTGFLDSTAASYDGNSFTVTVQNTSTLYTILMKITFATATLVGGTSGYVTANNLSVTGGSGTGMKVNIVASGGIVTSVTIADPGTGYLDADTVTIQQGGSSNDATFDLVAGGFSMVPTNFYLIPPEGSATFTFIKDSTTAMVIMVKDSGTLYSPVGPVNSNSIVIFDGTSGNMSSDTGILIDASDNITGVTSIGIDGATSGTVTISAPAIAGTTTFVLPPNNGTSGYVLSTDGSGVTTWISNTSPSPANFFAYGPAAPVTVSGTFTTVVVVTSVLTGAGYVNTAGSIDVATAGIYEISYTAQFQTLNKSGGVESSFGGRILVNATPATGSITECFVYEFNGDFLRASCSKTILVSLAASDDVALQVARTTGTTTAQTRLDQCTLTIRRVE